MSKPSAPTPPDYAGAATAQGQSNIQGAIANTLLSRGGTQTSPLGSQTTTQTGAVTLPGMDGQPDVSIPQLSTSMTLSPELQAIFDKFSQNQLGQADVAGNLLSQAGGTLSTPFDPSKLPADSTQQAVQDAMYARQQQYLDPQFAIAQKALDTKLANQGFQVNNAGYDQAQNQFADQRQKAYADARDSAINQGATTGLAQRQQAVAEALAARNQPINELSALMSGSQVSMPQFAPTPAQQIQGAPVFDAAQAANNAALQNFGINAGMYNSQLGGLMGLGGMGLLAAAL